MDMSVAELSDRSISGVTAESDFEEEADDGEEEGVEVTREGTEDAIDATTGGCVETPFSWRKRAEV